jgi:hypothetical protein
MKTAPITYFADRRITLEASARHYTDALNDWLGRNGIEIELQHGYMQGRYEPNPQQGVPPLEWPSIIVNLAFAEGGEEKGGSITVDGQTGALVIDGMRITSIANPGTDRFNRHVRTIAHEFIHAYNPLEGYHLLTYEPLGQDWRTLGMGDTTGIFSRNPGLRDDPWVDTQSPMERATICEFNRLLIQQNIRNPWRWSERGWLGEQTGAECALVSGGTVAMATLGYDRKLRWWRHRGKAYDLHEFLLAELKTGRREIVVTESTPEPPKPTPTQTPDASEIERLWSDVALLKKRIEVLETAIKIGSRSDNERLNALESKLGKVREVYEQALKVL